MQEYWSEYCSVPIMPFTSLIPRSCVGMMLGINMHKSMCNYGTPHRSLDCSIGGVSTLLASSKAYHKVNLVVSLPDPTVE